MSIKDELLQVQKGGLIRPKDVVEFARDPDTELHSCFEWDNDKAGDKYRLWQARQIIRLTITIIPATNKSNRMFVSLQNDRAQTDGGYRMTVNVLKNKTLRRQMIEEARLEIRRLEDKYGHLLELAQLFEKAAVRVRRSNRPSRSKPTEYAHV